VWRSPVARLHGVQEAVGSNPITPTSFSTFQEPSSSRRGLFAALLVHGVRGVAFCEQTMLVTSEKYDSFWLKVAHLPLSAGS
jgi:hypothetical protein